MKNYRNIYYSNFFTYISFAPVRAYPIAFNKMFINYNDKI